MGEKDKARQLYQQLQRDFSQAAEGEVAAAKLDQLRASS
jgi:hypothetical protein